MVILECVRNVDYILAWCILICPPMFAGSLLWEREAEQNNQDLKNGEVKQQDDRFWGCQTTSEGQPTKTGRALWLVNKIKLE